MSQRFRSLVLDDQACRLLAVVTADPSAPLRSVVIGPGAQGKSTFLAELAAVWRDAGFEVITGWPVSASVDWSRSTLVLDDVHLVADVRALRDFECPRLVVACRPWPRPPGLAELLQRPGQRLVALEPLDVPGVRRVLHGAGVSGDVAKFVHEITGGVPGWVSRVAAAWASAGGAGAVPDAAVASFRSDLELLDRDVLRYLIAAQSGMGLRVDLIERLLGLSGDAVAEIMSAARATGMLSQDGTLFPLCAKAVSTAAPAGLHAAVRQRLAELQLDSADEPVLPFARSLLDSGATGTTVSTVLHTAARATVADDPVLAASLYEGVVAAGRPIAGVVAEWAEAAALAGDLDVALRLSDQAISSGDGRGARVAATALAHRGQWAQSARLYAWSRDDSFAEIASIAFGQNEPRPSTPDDRPPTLLDGAAALMADGIRASVTGDHADALAALVRSSALLEPAARGALLPDSPAALAALVALHCGETASAESVLDAAVSARMGGLLMMQRHQLLKAWIQMNRGRLATASQILDGVRASGSLEPRDRLFAVGLAVGIARREGDTQALGRIWTDACDCLLRHPIDLFTFLPLGEFAVAAARLRASARMLAPWREAHALAQRLGNPALWVTQLHWSSFHAAIAADRADAARERTRVLSTIRTPYAMALAQAATCWLDVAAGNIDLPQVLTASRTLSGVGLWWDGTRLASEAAIRTADRKEMTTLLDHARQMQARQQHHQIVQHRLTGAPAEPAAAGTESPLSSREQEVADLVLQGMTYKQVGERLFISAKTVEHHMARMRHRLGAGSRGELLTQLRSLVSGQD